MTLGHIIDAVVMCGLGTFFLLMGLGKAVARKDPEEQAKWKKKWGGFMVLGGTVILGTGIYHAIRAAL